MFSWIKSFFKAKPPEIPQTWGIYVNGRGEYSVKYLLGDIYCPPNLHAANHFFKGRKYANQIQAEKAIADWENERHLDKIRPVKYLQ